MDKKLTAYAVDFFKHETGHRRDGGAIQVHIPDEGYLLIVVESPLFLTTDPVRAIMLEANPNLDDIPPSGSKEWLAFPDDLLEVALEYARAREKMLALTKRWQREAL